MRLRMPERILVSRLGGEGGGSAENLSSCR